MELHDFVAGRRPWAQLDRILARLPRHSRYKAAMEDDDEFAEIAALMEQQAEQRVLRVPLAGYDEHAVRLDNVFDAVNALREVLLHRYSRRGHHVQAVRAPRPETAQERAKRKKSMAKIRRLEDKLTGR